MKKWIILSFCLISMVIMFPLGLLGIVAVIWSLVDIFCQTAEISIDQFNKPFVMGIGTYAALQMVADAWAIFQKTLKK